MDSRIRSLGGQYVVFSIGKEEYGISIFAIREIVKAGVITQLPQMNAIIDGLIKLREQVIPVISLRKYLRLRELEDKGDTRVIILEHQSALLGINVDHVDSVINIDVSNIESSIKLPGGGNDRIRGVAKLDERLLILLDHETLFISELDGLMKETINEIE